MTAIAFPAPAAARRRRHLPGALLLFVWLLPFHVLAMTLLFGVLGLPPVVVRALAAWKELLVLALVALTVIRALGGVGPRAGVQWPDVGVAGLGLVSLAYLLGAAAWFGNDLPLGAQLLGLRDTSFCLLLYFVGRGTPEVASDPRYLRALIAVGVVTSAVAVVERLFVTPEMLIVLGTTRYVQDLLGLGVTTLNNPWGLPDNYWTAVGGVVVQRVGSTYLSSQAFAMPFLIIIPAATVWLFGAPQRRLRAALAYATLWVALLLTVTRMTIVVCALQVILVALLYRRWSVAVGTGLVTLAAMTLAFLAVPEFAAFLWQTLTWQTGSSVSHLNDWGEGLTHLADHPLGVGLGGGGLTAARFGLAPVAADSQYFKYGVDLGVLGLGLYLAVLAGMAWGGLAAFLRARGETGSACGAVTAAAAVGLALNGLTTVPLATPFFAYVFFWVAGSSVTLAGRRQGA